VVTGIQSITIVSEQMEYRKCGKKHVLFICHSFQIAYKRFGLAEITQRNDTSFGVMTMLKLDGLTDPFLPRLEDPTHV
jgi:hypothetical protein